MQKVVLKMNGIDKSFAGTHALNDINFELRQGEVHALLGENGAGKSTLIKILGGIYQPDAGEIVIDGKPVHMDRVQSAQALGVGIIHQEIVLVPHLSIAENIFLGREITTRFGFKDMAAVDTRCTEMMQTLDLDMDVRTPVAELTIAQQQMVEIVKAITFHVKILVMDEPTSSLSEKEVVVLFDAIRRLQKNGVSVIYISHRMEELFEITDRVTVIRDGNYVGTRVTAKTTPDELVSMMVGRSLESFYTREYNPLNEVVLDVQNVSKEGYVQNASFQVHKGEILGFSGLVGAGRSELMSTLFGAHGAYDGNVTLQGKPVNFKTTRAAIQSGMAMVPEDRKKQGLLLVNSVSFNITLAGIDHLLTKGFISNRKKQKTVAEMMESLRVKAASPDVDVASLSGGNQQKVLIAKWLATYPELLILDEPTRGIDVGAKQEIYTIINRLAKEGLAIILISSDLPEIINMCDSVCVMRGGQIVAQLPRKQLTQENIMKHATGGGI